LLGDSIVAGLGIRSLDDTISRQMEESLPKTARLEVLNLGVTGYQTLAESELLRTKGVKYAPDLVILVFDDNDFESKNNDISSYDPQVSGIVKLLLKKSDLFRFFALKFNISCLKFRTDMKYRILRHKEAIHDSVALGISRMKADSLKYGFDMFVVLWPSFSHSSPTYPKVKDFYYIPRQYKRLLRIEAICKTYGLDSYRLVDFFINDYEKIAAAVLPEEKPHSLNETYTIGDSSHPNVYGTEVAARGIIELLKRRKFLNDF
jgi:hypothetical protein